MAAGCGGCPAGAVAVDGPGDLGPRPGGHDLSAGGDVMDQVAAAPGRRCACTAATPARPRAAQRLGERHLPGVRPRRRALGAARAPARLPHRAGDRLRAGLDGRAARGGRGAHAAGAARHRRAAGGDGGPRRRRGAEALRAVRVPARDRAGRRARRSAHRPALRGAGRDHRADAPARPAPGRGRPGSPGSTGTSRRPSGSRPGGDAGRTASASARPNARCSAGWTTRSGPG